MRRGWFRRGAGGRDRGLQGFGQRRRRRARSAVAVPRSASHAATAADWSALGSGLAGRLVRPGDAQYATARQNFNPRFDATAPAGIAYCEHAADVAECLAFVRRFGLAVTPRCGGHSYVGASLVPGLVIDVSPMGSIRADTGSGTAVIGAGARMVDVYSRLTAARSRSRPARARRSAYPGLTLGGGVGVVTRAYGILSDNLRSVDVVTADGKTLHLRQRRQLRPVLGLSRRWRRDLRGGDLLHLRHPSGERARRVLPGLAVVGGPVGDRRVAALGAPAPDELWSNLHALDGESQSTATIQVGGTYIGCAVGRPAADRLVDGQIGTRPSSQVVETTGYGHAMMLEAGCTGSAPASATCPVRCLAAPPTASWSARRSTPPPTSSPVRCPARPSTRSWPR